MNLTSSANLRGLLLAGGKSSRMGRPKAEIAYHGEPEYVRCTNLLKTICDEVYLSTSEFWSPPDGELAGAHLLPDTKGESKGPLSGLSLAFQQFPKSAWVVLACDLPFFDAEALSALHSQRDGSFEATCFTGFQGRPEPLCAIYEPSAAVFIAEAIAHDRCCARKVLEGMRIKSVVPANSNWVRNVNEKSGDLINVDVQYVAQLRESAGISHERVSTFMTSPRSIYADLQRKYGFLLQPQHMRVAVNDEMVAWDMTLQDHDRVMFLPPVAGG